MTDIVDCLDDHKRKKIKRYFEIKNNFRDKDWVYKEWLNFVYKYIINIIYIVILDIYLLETYHYNYGGY